MKAKTKVSECCGSEPTSYAGPHGTPDSDSEDIGICPSCHDHCGYIEVCEECGEEKCACEEVI